jgi:hypothetical protein
MIDPIQTPTAAAPSASSTDPAAPSATTDVGVIAGAQKAAAPSLSNASTQAAQAAQAAGSNGTGSSGSGGSQSASDAVDPLRLLIEHDKATNQFVYKLYDSSGRIVREIPQESLADAEKQASGVPGSLFDTKV